MADLISPVVDRAFLDAHPEAILVDVRSSGDPREALASYLEGHAPGAILIDLDADLAAPATPEGGRHPLPTPGALAEHLSAAGISNDSVVVAYDAGNGSYAGRLVWMLRLLGTDAALLDGGLGAFGELAHDRVVPEPAVFEARPWPSAALATIDEACIGPIVVDSRAPQRYRGETEPLDPCAGHIPGAINAFFADNLDASGRFLPASRLRERFEALGITDASQAIVHCGSGVTACHNLIAMELAGLGRGRLFVGSWSAYCASGRPIATGPEPGRRPGLTAMSEAH